LLDYVLRSRQTGKSHRFDKTDKQALTKEEERKLQSFTCKVSMPILNMGQADKDRMVVTWQGRKMKLPKK